MGLELILQEEKSWPKHLHHLHLPPPLLAVVLLVTSHTSPRHMQSFPITKPEGNTMHICSVKKGGSTLHLTHSLRVFSLQLNEQMNRRLFTTRSPSSNSLGHLTLICIICSADVALVSPSMLTTHLPLVLLSSPVTLVHFACWLTWINSEQSTPK